MYANSTFVSRGAVLAAALAAALTATLAVTDASAQAQNGGTTGEWLMSYRSARTLGLGGAYVAGADDPLGILWNPAGLSLMEQNEVRFEHGMMFEDASVSGVGFAVPGSRLPSLGIAIVSMHSGDVQRTNDMNDDLGTFNESETAYVLTASRALSPRFALGANLKVVQQSVEDFSAGGFGADLGFVYDVKPTLRVAASVANLGGPSHTLRSVEETYPTLFRAGFAATVFDGRGLFMAQLDQASGPGTQLHAGGEYWIQPAFALRAGFDKDAASGGFGYRFHPQYTFDYAVSDHTLGLTHRVGLSYRFSGFFASSNADPQVFSPTGEKAVTRFSLNSRTKSSPREWTLDVRNKADEVVRRFGGKGQAPSHIEWDGKDETGMPLPDGVYRYRLVVVDEAGRTVTAPEHLVEISTGGPQGQVPVLPVQ